MAAHGGRPEETGVGKDMDDGSVHRMYVPMAVVAVINTRTAQLTTHRNMPQVSGRAKHAMNEWEEVAAMGVRGPRKWEMDFQLPLFLFSFLFCAFFCVCFLLFFVL